MNTIKVSELKANFYLFGNKGNVWSNTAHIAPDCAGTGRTLCNTPMLSSNHAKNENVPEIGCLKCISAYTSIHKVII